MNDTPSRDALQELIDRERIRDLLARYPMAFDDADWAAWDEIWTDDLVWVVEGKAIEGLPAVREFMVGCLPGDYTGKHLCGSPVIDLAPDGMSARTRTDVVWIAQNYENTIVARYVDDLVKRDGRWRISRREEEVVPFRPGPPPMSEESVELNGATMRPA
jgi:uncharacterized protein (TIGR02246 family)